MNGKAIWKSSPVVKAGQEDWFEIRFVVGQRGIDPGGGLRIYPYLTWHEGSPWTMVRWRLEAVRVFGPAETVLACSIIQPGGIIYEGGLVQLIEIENCGRRLEPGETLDIRFFGRAQPLPLEKVPFHIEVDPDGSRNYSSVKLSQVMHGDYSYETARKMEKASGILDRPHVTVRPGDPANVILNISPTSAPSANRNLVVKIEDSEGNLVQNFAGKINLTLPDGVEADSHSLVLNEANNGHLKAPITIKKRGVYKIVANITSMRPLYGCSHPFSMQEGPYGIYFGDIHAHSALSDGAGTPEEYYTYARDVANLSVAALADHEEMKPEGIKATEAFNEPGRFVTILGWEWACSKAKHHKNIYYPDLTTLEKLMKNTPATTPELFQYYRGRDVIIIPHHPNFATAWAWRQTNWQWHDDETERLVEICQICGNSETEASEGEWGTANNGASVRSALNKGYKFGFIGGTDDHFGRPGGPVYLPHPAIRPAGPHFHGLAAFLAKDLTRESIWESMKARRTYATTGDRIILWFDVNGFPMGSEIKSNRMPTVHARVDGTAPLEECAIIKNGKVVHRESPQEFSFTLEWIDSEFEEGPKESYYYFRIRQTNGQMAWASPVWVLKG